jgi:hypothetical protein
MKAKARLITTAIIAMLAVGVLTGCAAGGGQAPSITPDQAFAATKITAQILGVTAVSKGCKGGKFAGIPCDVAIAQVGPVVNTLAADFQPGALADPAKRVATREAAAIQIARALHHDDFATGLPYDAGNAQQSADVAEAHALLDPIADVILSAFGK